MFPTNASEMTFGQRLDILEALHRYDEALNSDNPELDGSLALRKAVLAVVDEDVLDDMDFSVQDYKNVVHELSLALQKRTETFTPNTPTEHLIANAIDRLNNYKVSFRCQVEAMALEAAMPAKPFTNSDTTSAFYSLTLKQSVIAIWPELLRGKEAQRDVDEAVSSKAAQLLEVSSDTMFHLTKAIVNFLKAWRDADRPSSLQSRALTSNPVEPIKQTMTSTERA